MRRREEDEIREVAGTRSLGTLWSLVRKRFGFFLLGVRSGIKGFEHRSDFKEARVETDHTVLEVVGF